MSKPNKIITITGVLQLENIRWNSVRKLKRKLWPLTKKFGCYLSMDVRADKDGTGIWPRYSYVLTPPPAHDYGYVEAQNEW